MATLALAVALLASPSGAFGASVELEAVPVAEGGASVTNDHARADLGHGLGHQHANASMACIPDADGRCETHIDCAPGTLNCWITRTPSAGNPCVLQPDGTLRCDGNSTNGNGTGPRNESDPLYGLPSVEPGAGTEACPALLAQGLCDRVPREADSPDDACRRLLAGTVCAQVPPAPNPPTPPDPRAACREVFAERLCAAAEA